MENNKNSIISVKESVSLSNSTTNADIHYDNPISQNDLNYIDKTIAVNNFIRMIKIGYHNN